MKKFIMAIMVLVLAFSVVELNASAVSYDKAKTAKTVKVYQKPGTSYKVLRKIPKGKSVKVTGGVAVGWDQENYYSFQQFGFSKIMYNNKVGYVKSDDLNYTNPSKWAPGIKKKANAYAKTYADGGKYRFVLESKKSIMYSVQVKFGGKWQYIGVVNCKTGWAHG